MTAGREQDAATRAMLRQAFRHGWERGAWYVSDEAGSSVAAQRAAADEATRKNHCDAYLAALSAAPADPPVGREQDARETLRAVRFRALGDAWQAVDRAIRPLGHGPGVGSNSPWNEGYERAKNEALNAILALRDAAASPSAALLCAACGRYEGDPVCDVDCPGEARRANLGPSPCGDTTCQCPDPCDSMDCRCPE